MLAPIRPRPTIPNCMNVSFFYLSQSVCVVTLRRLLQATSQFLHGSWPHVLLNSVGLFAFGPVTARLFGVAARGLVAFLAFYLTCGVLAGVGCIVFDLHPGDAVVGASGAISAYWDPRAAGGAGS